MKLPSVVSLKTYVKPSTHPAFTRFNVFLRDRFSCQYLRRARRSDLRSPDPALARRPHDLEQRRRRLLAVQSAQGQSDARRSRECGRRRSHSSRRCSTCIATAGCFRRTICTIAGSTICIGTPSSIRKRRLPARSSNPGASADASLGICCAAARQHSAILPNKGLYQFAYGHTCANCAPVHYADARMTLRSPWQWGRSSFST